MTDRITEPDQSKPQARILSIAGSDSSGGAGIQADTKTITALCGYAMTAITAITAQNTIGVQRILAVPDDIVTAQIESCLSDIGADAIKIGMLGSRAILDAVLMQLRAFSGPIVLDPVMVATSGAALADSGVTDGLTALMRCASVVTPNRDELAVLTGMAVASDSAAENAALKLAAETDAYILAKGGHAEPETPDQQAITDMLVAPDGNVRRFTHQRQDTRHTHGTGCTLSAALATLLGQGMTMETAAEQAIMMVQRAIAAAPGFGEGAGPLGHNAMARAD